MNMTRGPFFEILGDGLWAKLGPAARREMTKKTRDIQLAVGSRVLLYGAFISPPEV
jgi:hypothetical protein